MKHIACYHAAAAADVKPEIEMSRRMTAGWQNFDEFVETVRSGHKIGAAGFDDRHNTFAEGAEFGRLVRGIAVEFLEVIESELGKDVARVREGRHPFAVPQLGVPT